MFKRCQVVLLTANKTAEKCPLYLYPDGQLLTSPAGNSHLYITSDTNLKIGDIYYYDPEGNDYSITSLLCMDKIAKITTDFQLKKVVESGIRKRVISSTDFRLGLPHPSQGFIEKYRAEYNSSRIIRDVMVEYNDVSIAESSENYDDNVVYVNGQVMFRYSHEFPEVLERYANAHKVPKINLHNNTITIKKIKDSFTLDEVKDIAEKFAVRIQKETIDGKRAEGIITGWHEWFKEYQSKNGVI